MLFWISSTEKKQKARKRKAGVRLPLCADSMIIHAENSNGRIFLSSGSDGAGWWERRELVRKRSWKLGYPYERTESDPYLTPFTEINSRWSKELKVKAKL